MSLIVTCKNGHRFRAEDRLAGTTIACPTCRAPIAVPPVAVGSAPPEAPNDFAHLDLSQFDEPLAQPSTSRQATSRGNPLAGRNLGAPKPGRGTQHGNENSEPFWTRPVDAILDYVRSVGLGTWLVLGRDVGSAVVMVVALCLVLRDTRLACLFWLLLAFSGAPLMALFGYPGPLRLLGRILLWMLKEVLFILTASLMGALWTGGNTDAATAWATKHYGDLKGGTASSTKKTPAAGAKKTAKAWLPVFPSLAISVVVSAGLAFGCLAAIEQIKARISSVAHADSEAAEDASATPDQAAGSDNAAETQWLEQQLPGEYLLSVDAVWVNANGGKAAHNVQTELPALEVSVENGQWAVRFLGESWNGTAEEFRQLQFAVPWAKAEKLLERLSVDKPTTADAQFVLTLDPATRQFAVSAAGVPSYRAQQVDRVDVDSDGKHAPLNAPDDAKIVRKTTGDHYGVTDDYFEITVPAKAGFERFQPAVIKVPLPSSEMQMAGGDPRLSGESADPRSPVTDESSAEASQPANSDTVPPTTNDEFVPSRRFSQGVGDAQGLAISADRRVLCVRWSLGQASIYDSLSGRELSRRSENVNALGLDASGRFALTGEFASHGAGQWAITLWRTETAEIVRTVPVQSGAIACAALSPDAVRALVAWQDNSLSLWDLKANERVHSFERHSSSVLQVAFSGDGRRCLSRIGEGVFVWDTDTGKLVRRLPDGHLLVAAAAISPDGRRVVLAGWDVSDSSGDLRLYDTDSGQQVARLAGHRDQATALSFSPDGRWIASSGDNTVRLWDAHAGCQRRCLSVFRSSPQHLVCLSDTSVIVAPSLTTEGRHDAVVLWGTREAEAEFDATAKRAFSEAVEQRREGELCAIGVPPVTALSYLPDGQRLACTCRDGGVRILDPALARPVAEFEGHPYVPIAIAAAPDGRWMVTADHAGAGLPDDRRAPGSTPADAKEPPTGSRLIVWDVEQGREIRRIQVPDAFVEQVGISPAGDRLLTYGSPLASDGFGPDRRVAMIQIWNASTGARLSNFEVPNRGITVRFCEDGKQVFLATSEGLLGTWVASTGTGQRPVDLKTSVTCCAVFPDGRRVLLGNSVGCLANCLVSTGKGSVIKAHGFAPNSPRADRRRSSTTPDAPDAMEEGRPVEHVALLANGKRALTCGDDGTIAVWDLASQKELSRCKHDYDIHVLAVSPDGTTAATATSEDTVVVWGLPRPAIRAQ